MNRLGGWLGTVIGLLRSAVGTLALLGLLACSADDAAQSPTPRPLLFATPPAATSTSGDDRSGSDVTLRIEPMPSPTPSPAPSPTPSPTSTPHPTATPSPVIVSAGEQTPGPDTPTAADPAPGSSTVSVQFTIPKKTELTHPRAGSVLNDLITRVEAGEISAEEAAKETPIHRGDSVGVTIHMSGNVDAVVAFLEANGGSNISAGEDYIEAYVPVLLLGETSQQPGVLNVRAIQPPGESQSISPIAGNGPEPHGSTAWNQAGYSGRGIKVGVIDSGFSGLGDLLGTEMPLTVEARCYIWLGQHSQNLTDCEDRGSHGTVVAESVMDIAPEATLYVSDPQSRAELKDAVAWMISEDVSVINHSRLWTFDGLGDGTSPLSVSPLNTIDAAVAAGIVWVNAAGNQALGTWFKRGPFDYTTVRSNDENIRFINFSGPEFKNGESYIGGRLELRWEDNWGTADTDLDLFALAPGTDAIALHSINPQSGGPGHNPYEWVGSLATFDILVAHLSGPEPDWIQLVGWGPTRLTLNTSGTGSIINPAESANPGMLAVGAAPWHTTDVISNFSSRGPTPDGRVKPDVAAANCGETATWERAFCGTSQAAPHVAGMAALVRQRFPEYTPAQVVSYLKENAEQRISSPDPNNTWGHGFIVLPQLSQPSFSLPGTPAIASTTPGGNSLTVVWNAPSSDGGSAISAYDLRHIRSDATSKSDANWAVVQDVWPGSGSLRHLVGGLTGGAQYDLQVRAVNAAGDGPWSATVTGTPTQTGTACATGGAVPDAANNPGLVSDCDTLLEIRDTLAGTITLNWSASAAITTWEGVSVSATPQRVTRLNLVRRGLTGTIPAELSRLTGLAQLTLINNQLTGTIPSELGSLTNLTQLQFWGNRLVGAIPSEIGSLTNLRQLHLHDNRLIGPIPAELRHLTNLEELWLSGNQLSGTIPSWLGSLNNLQSLDLHDNQLSGTIPATLDNLPVLYLAGNQLTGCIPPEVRYGGSHDLHLLGMLFCDVLLVDLSITYGTFSPQFDAYVTAYTVAAHASQITVSPSNRNNATFEYIDPEFNILADADRSLAGQQVDVPTGTVTTIKLRVISPDRFGINTYTIRVTGPGAVGAPEIGQIGASTTSLTVSWSAPSSDGGSPITAYDLRHIRSDANSKADANWTVVQDVWAGSGRLSYLLTGLTGGTEYDVQLRAVNTAGDGPWSATVSGTTTATRPGAPSGLTATANGQTRIDLSWNAPQNTGGASFTGYRIEVSENRSNWSDLVANTLSTATGYSHTGLTAGSTRHYQVSAINAIGVGEVSVAVTASTASAGVAGAPTISSVTGQDQSLNILWSAPSQTGGSPIIAYDLRHIRSDANSKADANWTVVPDVWASSGPLSYPLTGLTGGTQYDVQLRAVNTAGDGPWSATTPGTTTATRPGAPSGLTATANGQTQIDLSWSSPRNTGGSPITGYRIEVSEDGSNWRHLESDTGTTTTSHSHTGLTAGSTHYYRVSAINSGGTGQASNSDSATTATALAPDLVVDSPTVSESAPAAGASFTLNSTVRNQGSGSSASTALRYYQSTDATITSSDTEVGTDSVSGLSASESGDESISLIAPSTAGTYYYGACVDSVSGESNTTNNCSAAVTVTVRTTPGKPPNQRYSWQGAKTVVSWDRSAGADNYKVYYDDFFDSNCRLGSQGTPSFCDLLADDVTGTSYTHTSPDGDRDYYWITACNSVGCSNIDSSSPARLEGLGPSPDLVVDSPTVSDGAPDAGARFTLNATVRNQGNGASDSTTLRYYQSTDSTITSGDTEVGTDSVFRLVASGSGGESISLTAPSTPGTYYYGACVDAVSDESDTRNNCSIAVVVTVGAAPAPDLVVDSPTVSESAPAAGASFTLNSTVRNQGSGSSASTALRYYQSTDATITSSDTEVGTDSVFRLVASGSGGESISLTAPSTPGTYYYGACVEPVSDESNTGNNCSSGVVITVSASASVASSPTGLIATANGQTQIDLSWRAPSDDGGASITGYKIEVSANGSNWSDLVANTSSSSTSYSHTGLSAGTTQHYRVSAINSAGTGQASNVANATTESAATDTCATGGAVSDAANNPGLVSDCETLLAARDTLQGTGTLNWSGSTSIANWDGIRVSGAPKRITKIDTSGKDLNLSGTIPSELGSLDKLTLLRLSNNNLTETIPPELGNLANLEWLSLWNNELTGTIPPELGNLTNLTLLRLEWNDLTGTIPPEFGNLTNLESMYLGANRLTGVIPSALGRLTNLRSLSLGGSNAGENQLAGTIPPELNNLTKLQSLNLWNNRVTGTIPAWLGSRTDMRTLNLAGNRLTGTIPTELGSLTKVTQFWLQDNQLTGTIPTELGNLSNVTELLLRNNNLTGTIPAELSDLDNLRQLLLANNQLAGCIPAGLRDVRQNDLAQLGLPDCGSATAPGAPTGLTATADGQTEIDLSWTEPSDDGGADITGYKIEVSTNGSSWNDLVADTGSASTSYSHTGLTAGTTRHYRVSAINSAGTGPASNSDSATTEQASAAAPGAPTGLTATADGQTEIDLSWTAPSDDGGASITGYKIEVSTNGSSWSDLLTDTGSTSISYSHTGLSAGTTRHYRVSAINSGGTGPASNTDSATTEAAPVADGTCRVGLIVRPGESCTYPGTSAEFSVDSGGAGHFLFFQAGNRIEVRNSTINGVTYNFVASKQSDGNWLIEEVG